MFERGYHFSLGAGMKWGLSQPIRYMAVSPQMTDRGGDKMFFWGERSGRERERKERIID